MERTMASKLTRITGYDQAKTRLKATWEVLNEATQKGKNVNFQ
jgi:hypothetical protein